MTLEYRCSHCGTLLKTTNADPLHQEIERLRAGLRSAQLQLSIVLQGMPLELVTLDIGFRRAYNMICAALRGEQTVRPRSAGNCPFCGAEPGKEHSSTCGLRNVPWSDEQSPSDIQRPI
jgi:hypothetical protein